MFTVTVTGQPQKMYVTHACILQTGFLATLQHQCVLQRMIDRLTESSDLSPCQTQLHRRRYPTSNHIGQSIRLPLVQRTCFGGIKINTAQQSIASVQQPVQCRERIQKIVARVQRPTGGRQEVQQMYQMVIQLNPKIFFVHDYFLIVNHTMANNGMNGTQLLDRHVFQFVPQRPIKIQPQHGRKHFDVAVFKRGQQRLQLWYFIDFHGKEIGAHAHDGMQQQHPW